MNLQNGKLNNNDTGEEISQKNGAIAVAEHARQVMAVVCHFNKETKIMPHTDCQCGQSITHCSKPYGNGSRSSRNPLCSILGPTLCSNCSVRVNRKHALKDTARIFEGFPEPADCSTREKALWNRLESIDEIDLDEPSDEEMYGKEWIYSSSFNESLLPGSIARNNSPCIEYIRTVNANNVPKHDFFYSKSLKETLRHISHIMNSNRRLMVNKTECTVPKRGSIPVRKPTTNSTDENTRLPAIITKRKATPHTNQTRQRTNRYSWQGDITASILDTEYLSQKMSTLIEKRTQPPVNRSASVESIESSIYGLELPPIESIHEEADFDLMEQGWSGDRYSPDVLTRPIGLPAI